jgi:hypothetical protein
MSNGGQLSDVMTQLVDAAIAACTQEADRVFNYWDVLRDLETRLQAHESFPPGLNAEQLADMVLDTFLKEHDGIPTDTRFGLRNVARLRGDRLIRLGDMRRAHAIEHLEVIREEEYRDKVDHLAQVVRVIGNTLARLVKGGDTGDDEEE